jgi:hypothetical protein
MASVSVPEKTLEHWCSQYVTYRYRAQSALWWPTQGADIDVRFLPRQPGKAFQLELKTTNFGSRYHDVWVDLGQLLRYWNRRRASQPFYAFPWPDWFGELEPVAVRLGVEPTDIGFSRSGTEWWFAEWMVVLTIDDVIRTVLPDVHAHRAAHRAAGTSEETRGTTARLVRFTPVGGGAWVPTWGDGNTPDPRVIRWRDFWTRLQDCGSPAWPQLVQLPRSYLADDTLTVSHSEVRNLLARAGGAESRDFGRLVWLEATDDGAFRIFDPADVPAPASQRPLPTEALTSQGDRPQMAVPGLGIEEDDRPGPTTQLEDGFVLRRPAFDESPDDGIARDVRQLTFLGASLMV